MPGNSFGQLFRITTWGESHGEALGVVVDGCPAGLEISKEEIQSELDRRRPGQSKITTQRKESDSVEILSGVFEGKTLGTPISLMVRNEDVISKSYEDIKDTYRPGHADYTYDAKYGIRDYRGGGRSSARETVGRVAAGAIAKKILNVNGISTYGFVRQVGRIVARKVDPDEIERNIVRCPDAAKASEMIELIEKVRKEGDSIGGTVEVVSTGLPPGLGSPVFNKLDADLAAARWQARGPCRPPAAAPPSPSARTRRTGRGVPPPPGRSPYREPRLKAAQAQTFPDRERRRFRFRRYPDR